MAMSDQLRQTSEQLASQIEAMRQAERTALRIARVRERSLANACAAIGRLKARLESIARIAARASGTLDEFDRDMAAIHRMAEEALAAETAGTAEGEADVR